MEQIRPRINITEEALERLEQKAAQRNQNINSYLSDLLNGKVTERQFTKRNDTGVTKEMHIHLPEDLWKKISEDASECGMSKKDYILSLLEQKGRPAKFTYSNSDLSETIQKIEKIYSFLNVIAQGVEQTNEIGIKELERVITKTDTTLTYLLNETKVERKNRKKLIREAKQLIQNGE